MPIRVMKSLPTPQAADRTGLRRFAARLALLVGVWLALTDVQPGSWVLGRYGRRPPIGWCSGPG